MKKKHPILGVICLAVLVCGGLYVFRAGAAKAEITIGEKTYEMLTLSVREFMGDEYIFSTMSTEGKFVRTYDYSGATMEAKTYYNTAVPFRPKDGAGASFLLALQSYSRAGGDPGREDLRHLLQNITDAGIRTSCIDCRT